LPDKNLILGIDIGSSSVRAALFDHSGDQVPKTLIKIERKLKTTLDGGSEIDADVAFRQIVKAVDELLSKTEGRRGTVTHIASCTFWHSLMGVDGMGKPTTPVLGWADNRSREYVATLRKKLNENETHQRTGARFHPSFWPAKLLWLKGVNPSGSEGALFTQTLRWISLGDYITLKLTGELATSISIASGTGIFSLREGIWDERLIHVLKLKRSQLPTVAESTHTMRLNAKFAKRWPRLAEAEWFLPVADGAANNIGSGCYSRGKAALMVGTSGAVRIVLDSPPAKIPDGLWCYRVDQRRFILGGALSDGGRPARLAPDEPESAQERGIADSETPARSERGLRAPVLRR
jgi:gluconokinase